MFEIKDILEMPIFASAFKDIEEELILIDE
jgi:hypothetical protein